MGKQQERAKLLLIHFFVAMKTNIQYNLYNGKLGGIL